MIKCTDMKVRDLETNLVQNLTANLTGYKAAKFKLFDKWREFDGVLR